MDSASLRQRSSVATLTPISIDTTSIDALSGGSNLATALSLNTCPYLAIHIFHQRPQFVGSIGAATILPRGAVLRLIDVVCRMKKGRISGLPRRFVCLTFDDGPDYDWKVVNHPVHGAQEPMIQILKRHSTGLFGSVWIRKMVATSFVIASPKAREEISRSRPGNPDRMSDDWWAEAQSSGFMDIGAHSWNHVHPSVTEMRAYPELVEAFGNIATVEQADLQVGTAATYIREKAGGNAARLFAYPYGHVSEFLAEKYLPEQDQVWAAFTTEGRPLEANANVWRIPRYVCGWHWKSNEELRTILSS